MLVRGLEAKMTVHLPDAAKDERIVMSLRCRMYRFDTEDSEWKERGTGQIRMLQGNVTKKVRLVMHRDALLKICANHYIASGMKIQTYKDNGKAVMYGPAPPDKEAHIESPSLILLRFKSTKDCDLYTKTFEKAYQINEAVDKNDDAELLEEIEDEVVIPHAEAVTPKTTPQKAYTQQSPSPSPSPASPFKVGMTIPNFGGLSLGDQAPKSAAEKSVQGAAPVDGNDSDQ